MEKSSSSTVLVIKILIVRPFVHGSSWLVRLVEVGARKIEKQETNDRNTFMSHFFPQKMFLRKGIFLRMQRNTRSYEVK